LKVKYKALVITVFSVISLIMVTSFVSYFAYFGHVNKQNYDDIKRSYQVIDFILNNEKDNMKTTLADWAIWEATYNFVEGTNDRFVEDNLGGTTLENLDLKMMIFLNNRGEVVYHEEEGLDSEEALLIYSRVLHSRDRLDGLATDEDIQENSNLFSLKDKVYMIGISSIYRSKDETQSNGFLIMIREIDEKVLSYISNVASITLTFSDNEEGKYFTLEDSVDIDGNIHIQDNGEFFKAYRYVKDINGRDSIVFTVIKEKADYNDAVNYFKMYIILFICIVVIIISMDILIIDKYILNRLTKLYEFMNTVADTRDATLGLYMDGNDEFSRLADVTNRMLGELSAAYNDIKQMDERYRLIMEATNDGYLDFFVKTGEVYISSEWKEMIGYVGEDGNKLLKDYFSKIHYECVRRMKNKYRNILKGRVEYFLEEYRVFKADGDIIWVQQRGKVVERDDSGRPLRIISTLSNITDRKKYEEEILYLSYSDKLTGLKNRAYLEKQFQDLDDNKSCVYAIIMGDLNGLKLANDSLGHVEGDRLLLIVSDILKQSCASDDIIARWGGDEFVILVKNKDSMYLGNLIYRIKEKCKRVSDFHFNISIALGYAEKNAENSSTEDVMSLAEKRMYRNKLMENKSARNSIISSLTRTLHEKHSETEEHTIRIKNLSLKLGKRLRLTQDKLDELELLALLHDIGKVGIPEHILMKPGKLTEEEWDIMKTHTEIGYRIAKSTPELAHIAEDILHHHEKYDGTGYPRGLRGNEIPILARIINITDSFDVMIHKRIYKDSFSVSYAINEIKECSGTQFDPEIVEEFLKLVKEDNISCEYSGAQL
jgi:diguanylate cyclase (GGDEF)-like protein/PAS domain S-box-containing protein